MNTPTNDNAKNVITTDAIASNALTIAVSGLDPNAAQTLRGAFEAMFSQADEWIKRANGIRVTSEDQKHEMKFARESRLALRAIRVNAEKTRKQLKEDSLRTGKAIDGIYNVIAALIEPVEEHLLEQEEFAERQAAKRRDALREARKQTLIAFGANPATFADLGLMADDAWSQVVDAARTARDAKATREREAREAAEAAAAKAQAEADDRRAAEAERDRVAAEDRSRLEREAAEARRVAAEERAAREKSENEARVERERQGAERRKAEEAQAAERARLEGETADARRVVDEERAARAKADADAQAERIRQDAEAARLRRERDDANDRAEAEKVAREKAERAASAPRVASPLRGPSLPAADDVQATLTAAGKDVLDVFTRARLAPSEALMVLARLSGLVQSMCVRAGEVGTSVEDLHNEFCERVETEREVMLKLAAEQGTPS